MCTLKTQFGIKWDIVRLAGRTAFVHNRLVIAYCQRDKQFHLVQNGKSVLRMKTAGECLDVSSEMILDAYASGITPSWDELGSYEVSFDEEEEKAPDTQKYPIGYVPDWAEAAA